MAPEVIYQILRKCVFFTSASDGTHIDSRIGSSPGCCEVFVNTCEGRVPRQETSGRNPGSVQVQWSVQAIHSADILSEREGLTIGDIAGSGSARDTRPQVGSVNVSYCEITNRF